VINNGFTNVCQYLVIFVLSNILTSKNGAPTVAFSPHDAQVALNKDARLRPGNLHSCVVVHAKSISSSSFGMVCTSMTAPLGSGARQPQLTAPTLRAYGGIFGEGGPPAASKRLLPTGIFQYQYNHRGRRKSALERGSFSGSFSFLPLFLICHCGAIKFWSRARRGLRYKSAVIISSSSSRRHGWLWREEPFGEFGQRNDPPLPLLLSLSSSSPHPPWLNNRAFSSTLRPPSPPLLLMQMRQTGEERHSYGGRRHCQHSPHCIHSTEEDQV